MIYGRIFFHYPANPATGGIVKITIWCTPSGLSLTWIHPWPRHFWGRFCQVIEQWSVRFWTDIKKSTRLKLYHFTNWLNWLFTTCSFWSQSLSLIRLWGKNTPHHLSVVYFLRSQAPLTSNRVDFEDHVRLGSGCKKIQINRNTTAFSFY